MIRGEGRKWRGRVGEELGRERKGRGGVERNGNGKERRGRGGKGGEEEGRGS